MDHSRWWWNEHTGISVMCQFRFQPVLSEEHIARGKILILSCLQRDPSFNFSINLRESDVDSFGCPCLKGWSTFSFWYDHMANLLCSETVFLPLQSAEERLGLYPELLETGIAPFTAVGSGHGVKTNARGTEKRHGPWDLFVNINIILSKNEKEKKLV